LRSAYTLLLYLATPFLFLRLGWLGFRNRGYRQGWTERLGFVRLPLSSRPRLWIHAVSVGEVQAATPLVHALRRQYPDLEILLTTTTPTGAERVRRQLAGQAFHCYLPYDLPGAIGRFLRRVQPLVVIIMETEFWPNLLHLCKRFNIPVILANGRLSRRSMQGYQRLPGLTRTMLADIAAIAAQTRDDADRFIRLGADPARVSVTGNLKFDVSLPADIYGRAKLLRRALGEQRPIWIAASTHEGEEAIVLDALDKLLVLEPALLLLLAPRHPERFDHVFELCQKRGLKIVRRSEKRDCIPKTQVFLIDTLGELLFFYAVSDVAFVGGSLVGTGGHNPLEPASLGVPILAGPHVFNFQAIFELLREAQAAMMVATAEDLASRVAQFLADAERRQAAGMRGLQVLEANRGAVNRIMKLVQKYLELPG
jgi:3-deoxy-D-manno-octulosonic-acid transferase